MDAAEGGAGGTVRFLLMYCTDDDLFLLLFVMYSSSVISSIIFLFYFSPGRKNRSRSVDHLLTDKSLSANVEISPQPIHGMAVHGDIEARLHSPARSSVTDEESGDGESVRRK